jgi:glycolate oxidase
MIYKTFVSLLELGNMVNQRSMSVIEDLKERQSLIVAQLGRVLPNHSILWEEEDTRPYECDGLSAYRALPLVVVLPESEKEVIEVITLCKELAVPIVPRGAGTGLSGGARPITHGVLLSLTRLKRILSLDPKARLARVQPGVRNLAISEAAQPMGLCYAPDPSSQIACSIGGNVSENAGGVHCLKYGLTLHNVLRVRGVLSSGEVIEVGGDSLDSPGLDLLPLIVGSEGMMMVITEVTVRLIPRPSSAKVIMASFQSLEHCGSAVAAIIAAGIIPAGLEMMDRSAISAAEAFVGAGYDLDAEAILLCESDGVEDEVDEEIARMSTVLSTHGASRLQCSESEVERLRFWSGRKNAFPAAGRISPDYYCMDGTIPRRHIAGLLGYIKTLEQQYRLRCMNVFHAGDGNMHPLILFNGEDPDEWSRAESFGNDILEKCIELGGTVTGEHGVGVEKLDSLCHQFTDDERTFLWELKAAFDPLGLLNPDKGLPSLRRCVELGRNTRHNPRSMHQDLERL